MSPAGAVLPALTSELARAAGGNGSQNICCSADTRNYTSVSLQSQLAFAWEQRTPYGMLEDDTPLMLVEPGGVTVSAIGLSWENTSRPYDEDNGPRLVGARLNRIEGPMEGEGIGLPLFLANDASVLYSEGDFQLRMLTSGGFSADGAGGARSNEFERYFRIHATGIDGDSDSNMAEEISTFLNRFDREGPVAE